ncbi:hypothetical protein RRG08_039413 [Elysia crispata]|uniref:Reverse transcriptase domain-containing protein n=1 Tax=Elysia crispata TaxID=231223 RepID=A0AAE1DVN5_9GAST|nr:hypothetical protein RRG08_039413 [Elysia crispata]
MKTTGKRKWMTEEILELMEKRRLAKPNKVRHKEINKEIKRKCDQAKEKWLNEQCEEIETELYKEPKAMYKRIQEITGRKASSKTGCVKSKDGSIIMEKDKKLERWSEYISELFDDDRNEDLTLQDIPEGPEIMREEVENTIKNMKTGKATGPDMISTEMMQALEGIELDAITKMLNTKCDTGEIPKEMLQSIFIVLPKKQGATECEQHRTISLMSHMTNILLRIIMKRIRNKVYTEIADNQCGFIEGKGTANAIYIPRQIIERTLEVNKDLYVCFIDYTKAFDRVRHEEIITILQQLNIDGKDLRIIKNIYWEQKAAVRVEEETSNFQNIKRGVRQGCVLSPDLFSLYSEMIMRQIEEIEGLKIGGHNINNIRYSDDTVLTADSEEKLQELLNKVVEESQNKGLELNSKKKTIKQANSFKYLGTQITSDGRNHQEIKSRIAQAKASFQQVKSIMTNIKMSIVVRKRILEAFIELVLLYGCEAWTIDKRMKRSLETTEMWFLRRMMRIPWTAKKTNEEVLTEAQTTRQLMTKIQKRQAKFVGHVIRRNQLEHLVTTGKFDGKRGRGRPREKMLDSLADWINIGKPTEMIREMSCRVGWRSLIAHASRHAT